MAPYSARDRVEDCLGSGAKGLLDGTMCRPTVRIHLGTERFDGSRAAVPVGSKSMRIMCTGHGRLDGTACVGFSEPWLHDDTGDRPRAPDGFAGYRIPTDL